MAIDDHSRVGFSLMLADETAKSACAFLLDALRYYRQLGVRVECVMTDNGSAYKSRQGRRRAARCQTLPARTCCEGLLAPGCQPRRKTLAGPAVNYSALWLDSQSAPSGGVQTQMDNAASHHGLPCPHFRPLASAA